MRHEPRLGRALRLKHGLAQHVPKTAAVFKNIGSNWVVSLATMGAIYFITPFTIHKLGDDGYGTWDLINAITGYLALLALGVPMASVRYFAEHVATGDQEKLNQAIGSCTALYLGLGAIALVVGYHATVLIMKALRRFRTGPVALPESRRG